MVVNQLQQHQIYLLEQYKNTAISIASEYSDDWERKRFAEAFCHSLLVHIWRVLVLEKKLDWSLPRFQSELIKLDSATSLLVEETALLASNIEKSLCGFFIGSVYTSLLPLSIRSKWGVFYTPPALAHRLISSSSNNISWENAKIIDPACGGAAFLAPVATEMWRKMAKSGFPPNTILQRISLNLSGIEIDSFAAWMSQVLTEIHLLPLAIKAGFRLGPIVRIGNALELLLEEQGQYDLVIGNPPYGKVKLLNKTRSKYIRSLYGHANLYGLFTDLGLRISKPDGTVSFVTPTSFLAGQYFKKLRSIIAEEAPPLSLDFVHQREGVFQDVLQETVLVVFKKGLRKSSTTKVFKIDTNKSNGCIDVSSIANIKINNLHEHPWLIPRNAENQSVFQQANKMRHKLADYSLSVSTGQLVWNRHKDQLRMEKNCNSVPLIWAESILPDGTFRFKSVRANHQPYFELKPNQDYLLTTEQCILVQRTTSKEQHRRIISAILPSDFLFQNGGKVVVENHLNIIKLINGLFAQVPLRAVNALLNSQTVDHVFRCISGSVAVSAYELNAIPLPEPNQIRELDKLIEKNEINLEEIEEFIAQLYG